MDHTLNRKALYHCKGIIPSFSTMVYFMELEPDILTWLPDLDTFETTWRQERYQSRSNSGYGMHTFPCIFTVKMH